MKLVVAIDTNGQRRIQRLNLRQNQPFIVGRAWKSDVIVTDEYVDASHLALTLSANDELLVEDLDSRNGTRMGRAQLRAQTRYDEGAVIALGESELRLHNADASVPETVERDVVHAAGAAVGNIGGVVAASLLAVLALVLDPFWNLTTEVDDQVLISRLVGVGSGFVAWVVLAGSAGKLFRQQMNGMLQWVFVSLIFSLSIVLGALWDLARFHTDSAVSQLVLSNALGAVLGFLFLYGSFSLCTRLRRARKLVFAAGLVSVYLLYTLAVPLLREEHERWTPMASVDQVTLPPQLYFGVPLSVEDHLQTSERLFAEP